MALRSACVSRAFSATAISPSPLPSTSTSRRLRPLPSLTRYSDAHAHAHANVNVSVTSNSIAERSGDSKRPSPSAPRIRRVNVAHLEALDEANDVAKAARKLARRTLAQESTSAQVTPLPDLDSLVLSESSKSLLSSERAQRSASVCAVAQSSDSNSESEGNAEELSARASRIASSLGLELVSERKASLPQFSFALIIGPKRLSLRDLRSPSTAPLSADFTSGEAAERALRGGFSARSPLMRACRVPHKSAAETRVLDGTAGLGVDAFVLAALGYRVTLCERDPIMFALLSDALHRARQHLGPLTSVVQRLESLVCADVRALPASASLTSLGSSRFDVCFLDPMYPRLKDKALPRKGMSMARRLLAVPDSPLSLVLSALTLCHRAVLKRPKGAEDLTDLPNGLRLIASHASKTTRFDVFGTS